MATICGVLISEMVAVLVPHLARVSIDQVFRAGATVRIRARTDTLEAACPDCGARSRRRHSHYERRLSDTAVGGQELLIHLRVHRFFCRNATCSRTTFAEQAPPVRISGRYVTKGATPSMHVAH
jgi:transposase